jgi:aminocarboxymuconate-semialdehyde decarboxylase
MMTAPWSHYGRTAARPAGTSGRERRPETETIDMHAHVMIPAADEFVRPYLDWSTIPLAHFASSETKALTVEQIRDRGPRMTGLADRLQDMDAMGVDRQLVMPSPFQCYHSLEPGLAAEAAQIVNDGVESYVAQRRERLIPMGTVAMQNPIEAVRELERCMKRGFIGVEILTNVHGRELSDPAFEPFWARAEALGALVALHPNGFTEGRRLSRFNFNNTIGNPFETTLALHYLIFDGVLERYPRLKIFAMHGGGYVGAYNARMDHAWGARSDANAGLPRAPTSYLRQIYVDSVVFSVNQLAGLVATFGADRVLMGTDYAFDMAESDPVGHIADLASDDAALLEALAGGNARSLIAEMSSHA